MTRNELIGLLGLILVAAGGTFAFGQLDGQIDGLGPERIRNARDEALRDISAAQEHAVQIIDDKAARFPSPPATKVWEWKKNEGPRSIPLIPVRAGICYLVEVRGEFDGGGEAVTIVNREGTWHLEGRSKTDKTLSAKASCWHFLAAATSE